MNTTIDEYAERRQASETYMIQETDPSRNVYDLLQARAQLGVKIDRDLDFSLVGLSRDGSFAFRHSREDDEGLMGETVADKVERDSPEALFLLPGG